MVENIGISRVEFEHWAQKVFNLPKTPSVRAIAKVSGISKSTISYQMNSDALAASSVIKISRGLGLSPLDELLDFQGFSFIKGVSSSPSLNDLLMVVPHQNIFVEAARRLGFSIPGWEVTESSLSSENWISWFKSAAPDVTYSDIKKVTGLSEAQIGKNQRSASWDIESISLMGSVFSFNIPFSLGVCGHLSLNEIGIHDQDLKYALVNSSNDEIIQRIKQILPHFSDLAENSKDGLKSTFLDHLG